MFSHFSCYFPSVPILFSLVLSFTFTSLVNVVWESLMADVMVAYGPPQCCNCQKCTDLAAFRCAKGGWHWKDADYWFMFSGRKKKQTINSWQLAQITTSLGCCGKSAWPEITGLSVPCIFYDIQRLVANMKQGVNGNTSHMVFHSLIKPERSQMSLKTSVWIH